MALILRRRQTYVDVKKKSMKNAILKSGIINEAVYRLKCSENGVLVVHVVLQE